MPQAASRSPRRATSHSPWVVLLLCWSLALGLGAHVGRELRLETERDVALGDRAPWQAAAAGVLAGVGELTGVAELRAVLHEPVRTFYGNRVHGGRPGAPASFRCRGREARGRGTGGRGNRRPSFRRRGA